MSTLVMKLGIIGYRNHALRLRSIIEKKPNCRIDFIYHPTKKIDDKGKIVDLEKKKFSKKEIKVKSKDSSEKKQDEGIDLSIKDHKNLNKTIDLAVIIKKLKKIRDEELNNNKEKNLKKKNKEIIKLNETIDLAEDLFKKELLDL